MLDQSTDIQMNQQTSTDIFRATVLLAWLKTSLEWIKCMLEKTESTSENLWLFI